MNESTKTYLTFHFYGLCAGVSIHDGISHRDALERVKYMGYAFAVDSLIECSQKPRAKDYRLRKAIADDVSSNREEAIRFVENLIEQPLAVLAFYR